MNLIILMESDRLDNERFCLRDNRAEHIRDVLKLEKGEKVQVGLLNGPVGQAVVEVLTPLEVVLKISELRDIAPPEPIVDLVCALPRPQTLKKVLFTSAMMGIRRLYFIRAGRVEKSYFQSPLLGKEKYTPHLIEGLAQGKLTFLPEIHILDRFKVFFDAILPVVEKESEINPAKLVASPESSFNLGERFDKNIRRIIFAIGPEGGWLPFELEYMEQAGFRQFTLGRRILRVEHAVTAALSQMELLLKLK
ncbi:MAG: RsmE family RNA methyltransferase [candidate division Zixibacteria bacterium]|nr:RsmE family RNA methyltransferase [candidate division Zixibacteria bacterium]MDD5425697.1 RsmE family RNA methyltransferase [candidate division Zixibacteria bacterium]